MKYLAVLLVLMACRHPLTTSSAGMPVVQYGYVPTWKTDTMVNGYRLGADTFYSFMKGDTSGVIYNGDSLYIFGTFDTTLSSSLNAWIGPDPMDSNTAYSRCFIGFYKYWSVGDNKQKYAPQMLHIVTRYPNFSTTGDAYYLGKQP